MVIDGRSQTMSASAAAFMFATGNRQRREEGRLVRHRCDNRPCCNPKHLVQGTPRENTDDAVRRGRIAAGEKVGTSKLTAEDVVDIRRRHAEGDTVSDLARDYSMSRRGIRFIVIRRNWKHVP